MGALEVADGGGEAEPDLGEEDEEEGPDVDCTAAELWGRGY